MANDTVRSKDIVSLFHDAFLVAQELFNLNTIWEIVACRAPVRVPMRIASVLPGTRFDVFVKMDISLVMTLIAVSPSRSADSVQRGVIDDVLVRVINASIDDGCASCMEMHSICLDEDADDRLDECFCPPDQQRCQVDRTTTTTTPSTSTTISTEK